MPDHSSPLDRYRDQVVVLRQRLLTKAGRVFEAGAHLICLGHFRGRLTLALGNQIVGNVSVSSVLLKHKES